VIDVCNMPIAKGGHDKPESGMCIMEMASYVAREKFSDHPECVSKVIGAFCRSWNDSLSDEDSPPQLTIRVGDMDVCEDCLTNLIDNEVERRGTEQLEKDFASYHSGTAPYPFTAQEQLEEQARIQRGR
jgi:hypothetical protein